MQLLYTIIIIVAVTGVWSLTVDGVGTAPQPKDRNQDHFPEATCVKAISPSHSAPAAVTTPAPPPAPTAPVLPTYSPEPPGLPVLEEPRNCVDDMETDTEYQDARMEHVCTISENVEPPKQGRVRRFRAKIAPGHHKSCTALKKDSLKDKNPVPHGHHHTKNVNHHQCCGAFGNPHVRHKVGNSGCRLI